MHASETAVLSVPFVDLKAQYQSLRDEINTAIAQVLSESAFIGGSHVATFEKDFAAFCGVADCVGVANGTDALWLALRAVGIGAGDEVITAANSFIATAEAITLSGAKVCFVDVRADDLNIDVSQIEARITPRTKAIIPVHLYGRPADMDAITDIARRHRLYVIADAAQAHGATYRGTPIAHWADLTCFSFYPGKNLGAYGDGGAVVTDNSTWTENIRVIANHGRSGKYNHRVEGVNSRLDGLQAAILNVKLRHLSEWTRRRQAAAALYNRAFVGSAVVTPSEPTESTAVYHLYVVRVHPEKREGLQQYLAQNGIQTAIHYPIALPCLEAYAYLGHRANEFPNAVSASTEILSIPIFAELTEEQIQCVAHHTRKFIAEDRA